MKKILVILSATLLSSALYSQYVKMVIGDNNNTQIVNADLTGGDIDTLNTGASHSFYDADVDEVNQKIYMAWYYGIYRMNYDGSSFDTLVNYSPGGYSDGIVVDETNNKIYWTNTPDSVILSADLDGNNIDTLLNLSNQRRILTEIDIDTVNGHFYFGSWIFPGKGLYRCNLNGTGFDTIIAGMDVQYLGLNVGQSQIMYSSNSEVRRINFDGSGDTLMFSFQPGGMIYNTNNNLWYISDMTNSRIITCDNDGNNMNAYMTGGLDSPHGPVFVSFDVSSVEETYYEELVVYPNPAKEFVTISIPQELIGSYYSLLDASGRIILKGILNNELNTLSLINLPSGMYLLQIGDPGYTVKILH